MESSGRQQHRRVDILYLVSRGAKLEHPHMLQVQYPSDQEGPTLKDVKVRLTALRGKGMPNSYSWSYKRNYKDTFIWCDLFDDDLIFPLHGSGEYVLKALEVFDASQDQAHVSSECLHLARKSSPSMEAEGAGISSTPSKSNSMRCAKPEQLRQVECDLPSTISQRYQLIGDVCNDPSDSSIDLNQEIMFSLSRSITAPEMCSVDHSDFSSSGTCPCDETKRSIERTRRIDTNTCLNVTEVAAVNAKHSSTSSLTENYCSTTSSDSEVSPSPRHHHHVVVAMKESLQPEGGETLREESLRRTWIKSEVAELKSDSTTNIFSTPLSSIKSPILTSQDHENFVSRDVLNLEAMGSSAGCAPCLPGDPFLFLMRKASRFHRPQLCRHVDVVETNNTLDDPNLSKHGSKASKVVKKALIFEKTQVNNNSSFEDKTQRNIIGNSGLSPDKPAKEVKSLFDFLEMKEDGTINSKLVARERKSMARFARKNPGLTRPENTTRAVSSDTYDTSARCREVVVVPEVILHHPAAGSPGDHQNKKATMVNDSNGNIKLVDVKLDMKSYKLVIAPAVRHAASVQGTESQSSVVFNPTLEHTLHVPKLSKSCEDLFKDTIKEANRQQQQQRRPTAAIAGLKETTTTTTTSHEASIVGDGAPTHVSKSLDEKLTKESRDVSRDTYISFKFPLAIQDKKRTDIKLLQPSGESCIFDSPALHHSSPGCNNEGLQSKMLNPKALKFKEAAAAVETSSTAAAAAPEWPKGQPMTLFKNREERPLTPGLTISDWERTLQEAVIHGQPPADLVLHECFQRLHHTMMSSLPSMFLPPCNAEGHSNQNR